MRWQNREGSSNVEDRRRMGPPAMVGGGGIVAVIIAVIIALMNGQPAEQALQQGVQ